METRGQVYLLLCLYYLDTDTRDWIRIVSAQPLDYFYFIHICTRPLLAGILVSSVPVIYGYCRNTKKNTMTRHEQYANLRTKRSFSKKRNSLSSSTSGVDSGYNSSASNSTSPTTTEPPSVEDCQEEGRLSIDNPSIRSIVSESSLATDTTSATSQSKKRPHRAKKNLSPRQPDLVYSCPRPLAFPFHNDGHFLPVAEADPRDVARISPARPLPSIRSTRSYSTLSPIDVQSTHRSTRAPSFENQSLRHSTDGDSTMQRPASLLSTVQRGTVNSLRSFFQLASSPTTSEFSMQSERLPRLEVKRGTVQSLRELFSKHTSGPLPSPTNISSFGNTTPVHTSSPSQEASSSSLPLLKKTSTRIKEFFSFRSSRSPTAAEPIKAMPQPAPSPDTRGSIFAARHFWGGRTDTRKPITITTTVPPPSSSTCNTPEYPKVPTTPPTAHKETKAKTLTSEIKKMSSKVFSFAQKTSPSLHEEAPLPRRSFFSSFQRSKVTPTDHESAKQKSATAPQQQTETTQQQTSTVGRMWKSFKSIVGKKSSRVGVV
ncbi:hypothetical protein BDF14DRAFT_1740019 [Spinellus fusiger]|nr:hypothetical protein BDF14DRAFT_1740019 [Spinellus fusiger]